MDRNMPGKIDSKFRFVLLSAERAEQLLRGARPRTDVKGKVAIVAMSEIQKDLIGWEYGPAPEPEPVEVADEEAVESDPEIN